MRLWSLHPAYLDTKGLTAVWREGLLAKAVLQGKTRGYQNHPQLARFKAQAEPIAAINAYLAEIYQEAARRGYHFDAGKLDLTVPAAKMTVTEGQLRYEWQHLQQKLLTRDPQRHQPNAPTNGLQPHPLRTVIPGEVETWERRKT